MLEFRNTVDPEGTNKLASVLRHSLSKAPQSNPTLSPTYTAGRRQNSECVNNLFPVLGSDEPFHRLTEPIELRRRQMSPNNGLFFAYLLSL